jgi:hypothetical protein
MKNVKSVPEIRNKEKYSMQPLAEGIPFRQLQLVSDRISLYRRLFFVTIMANFLLAAIGLIYL